MDGGGDYPNFNQTTRDCKIQDLVDAVGLLPQCANVACDSSKLVPSYCVSETYHSEVEDREMLANQPGFDIY